MTYYTNYTEDKENETSDIQEETTETNKIIENVCEECGGEIVFIDNEYVCEDCGLVIEEDNIDRGAEWRSFSYEEEQSKSRTGAPIQNTKPDKGLKTTIDWKNKDANGNNISPEQRRKMSRLRKWNSRLYSNDSNEKNLRYALSELDRMISAIDLPDPIHETAAHIYRESLKNELIRGRSIEGVVSASIYASCRLHDEPRTFKEIADKSRVNESEIRKTYRYIKNNLGLKINVSDPSDYVSRFCSELDLSKDVENEALEIIEQTKQSDILSGKSPSGIAASSIYIATIKHDEKRTQKEIAEVSDVTSVTIRNRYQEQQNKLDIV